MNARAAFTVVETLVAVVLLLLVLQAGWVLVAGAARAAAALADRGEALAASRAAGWILQEELEAARAGVDVTEPRGDSFRIRAFRGTAIVCACAGPAEAVVRWTGMRAPNPDKDSVLVLLPPGVWTVRTLRDRESAPGACTAHPAGVAERWTLREPAEGAVLLRLFETGRPT